MNPKQDAELRRLGINEVKARTGLFTGHGSFGFYSHNIGLADSPLCHLCGESYETSIHILCHIFIFYNYPFRSKQDTYHIYRITHIECMKRSGTVKYFEVCIFGKNVQYKSFVVLKDLYIFFILNCYFERFFTIQTCE